MAWVRAGGLKKGDERKSDGAVATAHPSRLVGAPAHLSRPGEELKKQQENKMRIRIGVCLFSLMIGDLSL